MQLKESVATGGVIKKHKKNKLLKPPGMKMEQRAEHQNVCGWAWLPCAKSMRVAVVAAKSHWWPSDAMISLGRMAT